MFVITKWCKSITDSGKDEYTKREVPKECIHKFRLLDSDQVVYAYGMSDDCNSEKAFAPLDYYENDYGCVEIQYKNPDTGEYETL